MRPKVTKQTYKVQYCDCGKDGVLKTSRLCELFEGIAMDALLLGCEGDLRTVMMRYRIVFDGGICGLDNIDITTYLATSSKYASVRRFEVIDKAAGATRVRAAATWTYMSLAKQRIAPIPQATADYVVADCEPFDECEKLKDVTDGEIAVVQLRDDDFDHNGHVNNAKYFSYMSIGIPREIRRNRRLKEVCVNYDKGIKPGACLQIMTKLDEQGGLLTVMQKLTADNEKCALIQSIWE